MKLLMSALLVAGCATLPHVPQAPPPALVHGGGGPEVDRLVEDFYGDGLQPEAAATRAAEVLRQYPDCARAHEVAALAATLLGDSEVAWQHFLHAAADLDADATELYLWELGQNAPRGQAETAARLYDQLRRNHPRGNVRALATARLARYYDDQGRFAEEEALPIAAVDQWQLLGPFDNDQGKGFLNPFHPEHQVDLAAEIPGPLVPLHWRKVERLTRDGRVPLASLVWPAEFSVAYLATWVRSDREQSAQLRITTAAPLRVFVNDALVLSEELIANGGDSDGLVAPVTLHNGWNQILIKSAERRGWWSLRARISDGEGQPLPGLAYSAAAQKYSPGEARKSGDSARVEPEIGGPAGRRQFLESQLAARAGKRRPALTWLQELLAAHPHNLAAQYFGALAYWDNEELGKAIDLLNQGVESTHSRAAGFLVKRSRYYSQKQLWEKAQSDLTAATALPGRAAQLALAELYEKRGWIVDRCQVLAEILGKWPDYQWALRERAECLDSQGYSTEAEKLLKEAAAWSPGDDETWERLVEMARRKADLGRALALMKTLKNVDPVNPGRLVEEADLLRRNGDAAGAKKELEEAARQAPEWPRPWQRIGDLAYEHGQRAEALTAWKRARDREPNNQLLASRIEFLEPTRLGYIEKYVPTDAEIDAALLQKTTARSGAQVAMRIDHEVTEVNADGSARRVVTQVQEALDEKGRDTLTHERLPGFGTLKILKAYAIVEKGERQEASSIRGGEVRFRNLQVGSKTVIQYLHYQPPAHFLPNAFASQWYFQSASRQHINSTWVLVLPLGHTLHEEKSAAVEEKKLVENDREVRIYRTANLPPLLNEPSMAPTDDLLAHVAVSTVDSWDDYVRWERALLTDAFHSNPSLDALIDKLLSGAKSPREKLDKLFHHVAQEVRYQQDYETTVAGVRPHSAPSVVERGYGDCKDKAVLLIQMARRAGLNLHFAILRTTPFGHVLKDIPNQQFNHAIVYVPEQPGIEKGFFMDPTSDGLDMGNLRADDQGAVSLVMDPESGKWEWRQIPYQTPELQYDHHKIRIDVKSPTDAQASDEISMRGVFAMGMRHVLRNQGEARKLYETIAAALFPGATVRDAKAGAREDIWRPLTVTLEIDGSNAIRAEDEHYRLTLPHSFRLQHLVDLARRETPLRLGAPESSTYDIDAALPDGYKVVHAPKDFTVEHACFTLSRKAKVESRHLNVHVEYARRCTDIAVADYVAFRESVQQASQKLNDDLLWGK